MHSEVAVVVAAALILGSRGAWGQVTVDPPEWRVTRPIPAGKAVSREFLVRNDGPTDVVVLNVTCTAGIVAQVQGERVPAHSATALRVTLDPSLASRRAFSMRGVVILLVDPPTGRDQTRLQVSAAVAGAPPLPEQALPERVRRGRYQPRRGDRPVRVRVHLNSDCGECVRYERRTVDVLQRYYGRWVTFERHSIRAGSVAAELAVAQRVYRLEAPDNINFFVGSYALLGEQTPARLMQVVESELQQPTRPGTRPCSYGPGGPPPAFRLMAPPSGSTSSRRFRATTLLAILSAGLIDGLNPCAFATAVFLIALLTHLGHDRRTMRAAGTAFASAVFVVYLLLGLGVLHALDLLGDRVMTATAVRYVVAGFGLVVAGGQVWDVVRLRRGVPSRALLMQMPRAVQRAVHRIYRKELSRPTVALGAAIAGSTVTLLEMVCTSQVYVPILVGLHQPELRAWALPLLVVYTVGFVLPLVVLLALACRGVRSERLVEVGRRQLPTAKLLLALLLTLLALWLLCPVRLVQ